MLEVQSLNRFFGYGCTFNRGILHKKLFLRFIEGSLEHRAETKGLSGFLCGNSLVQY